MDGADPVGRGRRSAALSRLPRAAAAAGVAAGLAVAAAFAVLPGLGQDHEWAAREVRQAEIAREMAEPRGSYLVPRLGGEIFTHKPPLFHWLAAAAYALAGGPSLLAARIPSALAAIALVVLTYALARRLATARGDEEGDERRRARTGIVAAIVLAASPQVLISARTARPDMVLAALVAGAWLAVAAALARPRGDVRRLLAFGLAGVLVGCGFLTKGPIALGLVFGFGLVLALAGATRGQRPRLGECGLALFLAAAVVGAWALPASREGGPGYLERFIFQHDLVTGAEHHARSPVYYLGPFAAGFAPWVLALPFAIAAPLGRWRRGEAPLADAVPAIAFAAIFVAFSAIPGKRGHYLLPAYPCAAIAVASWLERTAGARRSGRLSIAGVLVVAGVIAAGVGAYYAGLNRHFRGEDTRRAFALAVRDRVPADAPLVFLAPSALAEVLFTTERSDVRRFASARALAKARLEPGTFCVAMRALHRELPPEVAATLETVASEGDAPSHYLLLLRRRAPAAAPP